MPVLGTGDSGFESRHSDKVKMTHFRVGHFVIMCFMSSLVIIRGNSGSGKTTLAKRLGDEIKKVHPSKKVVVVGQDVFRRKVLGERGNVKGLDNPDLIEMNVKFCLDRGYLVIVEGIFNADTYREMFSRLIDEAPSTSIFYLDISFNETLNRHETKAEHLKQAFGEEEMMSWYKEKDFLSMEGEIILSEDKTEKESLNIILEHVLKNKDK